MVNYDKWDTLEVSDDEEDTASRRATVTRLDAPSRVTFGGGVGKNAIEVASSSADVVTPGAAAAAATKRAPASSFHGTDYARFDAIARDVSDDEEEAREYYEDEAWEKARGKKPPSSSIRGAMTTTRTIPRRCLVLERPRMRPHDNAFARRERICFPKTAASSRARGRRRVRDDGRRSSLRRKKKKRRLTDCRADVVTDEGGGHAERGRAPGHARVGRSRAVHVRPSRGGGDCETRRENRA